MELKDGRSAEFPLESLGANQDFVNIINQKEIQRIKTLEATLEEVFIQITGKVLAS